jgi:signal transduction histidine kinase
LQPLKVFFWQRGWFQITISSVCGIAVLVGLRLMAQLALQQKEQLLLQEERARIARDIHDDIGARMTELVLRGEVAQNGQNSISKMREELNWICDEARGLLSTMDEILWAVNPRRDTLRDFSSYVCAYAREFLEPTKIQCFFEVEPEMSAATFDLPHRRSLLMAIKETLNNAVKYSEATELLLKIQTRNDLLVVVVHDNGKGFDSATIRPGRNGLTNMAERMSELGGSCTVTSSPGKGCKIEFSIPLAHSRRHSLTWIWSARHFADHKKKTRFQSNDPSQNHDPTQS